MTYQYAQPRGAGTFAMLICVARHQHLTDLWPQIPDPRCGFRRADIYCLPSSRRLSVLHIPTYAPRCKRRDQLLSGKTKIRRRAGIIRILLLLHGLNFKVHVSTQV